TSTPEAGQAEEVAVTDPSSITESRKRGHGADANAPPKVLRRDHTLKKCIKKSDFHWTAKAKQAFQQLKQHVSELPLLVAHKPQEELIIYVSATYGAISVVLMTRTGNGPDANLLYKPRVTGSGTKLLADEETGLVTSLHGKKTATVFSGTSYHGHYRPAHQASMSRPDVVGRLQK
nr:reverse transcriptase domain-containing protein [Tanacetum cinerariifolium]GFB72363.1 reverse transcriptase domain-containing protein [Tanacetum cinerariifolium]